MRISWSRSKPLGLAILFILVLRFFHHQRRPILETSIVPDIPGMDFGLPMIERQKSFWKFLHPIIESHNPNCTYPDSLGDVGAVAYDPNKNLPRPSMTVMDENAQKAMKEAHSNFIMDIKAARTHIHPVSIPGTRGVVTSAGGNYLPVLVPSLRMLRRTGSTLPVEVFMKNADEYEAAICDGVLPSLNARCLVLGDVIENVVEGYQLKIFAVLLSSFEEVVWMDADCFPVAPPESLLDSEPFRSSGIVTWPDFWASSASPLYYQISHQEAPPMSARQSSEAGVFLVSKRTHFLPLLLASYYNYYGPSYYYRLLSQGAPDEGDKETFLQATMAVGAPFYAVRTEVQAIGHLHGDRLAGSAMVQVDPQADYVHFSRNKWWAMAKPHLTSPLSIFFIHAHYPKFNPGGNVFGSGSETTPTLKEDGSAGRAWTGPSNVVNSFGYDIERAYWEEIKWVTCHLATAFKSWRYKTGLCQKVESYWHDVFGDSLSFSDKAPEKPYVFYQPSCR